MKVVIRMPNHLGDFVMALGFVREIEQQSSDVELSFLVKERLMPLAEIALNGHRLYGLHGTKWNQIKAVKAIEEKFDVGLLLTNSASSAFIFSFLSIQFVVGFTRLFCSFLIDKRLLGVPQRYRKEHQVDTYKKLLTGLDLKNKGIAPSIHVDDELKRKGSLLLRAWGVMPGDKVLMIHASAVYGVAKCYPIEQHEELVRLFLSRGEKRKVVLIGTAEEREPLKRIEAVDARRVINGAGKTDLGGLTAILSVADCLVANDSGPMHLADSIGVNLIALFGSSSPRLSSPYSSKTSVIRVDGLDCMPCFSRTCKKKHFGCMRQIAPSAILKKVERYIPTESKGDPLSCIS